MSCVAEPNATNSAKPTKGVKLSCGLAAAMPSRPNTIDTCANNNQLRRRPNMGVNTGIDKRSTSGAHTHLKP